MLEGSFGHLCSGWRGVRAIACTATKAAAVMMCLCSYQSTGLPSVEAMQQEYSQTAQALLPYVDVFVAETLSTVAEAQAALQATAQLGKPSLCCLQDVVLMLNHTRIL
jgi:S-methylmethionine-dependent homocysteine/selenocysteine methylase